MWCKTCRQGSVSFNPSSKVETPFKNDEGKTEIRIEGRCEECRTRTEFSDENMLPRKPLRSIRSMKKRSEQFMKETKNDWKPLISHRSNLDAISELAPSV